MKRRAFLGFLGGAVAAGPKAAADMTLGDTNMRALGLSGGVGHSLYPPVPTTSHMDYATKALGKLALGGVQREMRKRNAYFDGIDPEIACLRSVALSSKVRMSREVLFDRAERREKTYLEGVISGLWE